VARQLASDRRRRRSHCDARKKREQVWRPASRLRRVATSACQADLGQVDDCRAVVAAADAAFGRVDILVNAAGITTARYLEHERRTV